jgi:hypothetical protein
MHACTQKVDRCDEEGKERKVTNPRGGHRQSSVVIRTRACDDDDEDEEDGFTARGGFDATRTRDDDDGRDGTDGDENA